MSASVLGKRTRSQTAENSGVQTRSKRRSVAVLGNDENENPFITRGPGIPEEVTGKRPAKHASPLSKAAPSPAPKINAHFSVKKSATSVDVLKDGKLLATPQTPRFRDALLKKVQVTPRHRGISVSNPSTPRTPRTPSTPSASASSVYNQGRQLFARCTDPGVLIGREDEKKQLADFVSERVQGESGGCLYISGPPGTGKSAFVAGVCLKFASSDNAAMSTVNCMSIKNARDLATTLSDDLNISVTCLRGTEFDFLRKKLLEPESGKKYIVILDEIDRLVDLDLNLLYSLFEWSMAPTSSLILIGIANALDLTDRFLPRLKSRNLKPTLLPFMPYTAPQIANIITEKLRSLIPADSEKASDKSFIPFLHPAAITFCSKKVASQTGDLRKAFDITHRAISLIESETRAEAARQRLLDSPSKLTTATPLMENINLASPPLERSPSKDSIPSAPHPRQTTLTAFTTPLTHLTLVTAPRATIAHMAKITAQVFSTTNAAHRLSFLTMQQKAVLCALAALEAKKLQLHHQDKSSIAAYLSTPTKSLASATAPSVRELFDTYTALCTREKMLAPLSSGEFRDVVSGLETLSLISAVELKNGGSSFSPAGTPRTPSRTPSRRGRGAKSGGFAAGAAMSGDERRMALAVSRAEVEGALTGAGSEILREMLEGGR